MIVDQRSKIEKTCHHSYVPSPSQKPFRPSTLFMTYMAQPRFYIRQLDVRPNITQRREQKSK